MSPEKIHDRKNWRDLVAPYQVPHVGRATWQCLNTFIPYVALWALMSQTVHVSYLLTFGLALIAAGFFLRIFIICHDCGHGSFFSSRRANDICGVLSGFLTLVPHAAWRHEHAVHHAGAGNLDERGIGDVTTLTAREYLALPWWRKVMYRIYRQPVFLFGVGAMLLFLVRYRVPMGLTNPGHRASVWRTNIALALFVIAMSLIIGWKEFLIIQFSVLTVSASAGVWLFYVQHQFEGVYWNRNEEWDYVSAALDGSSYYKLPRVLQWFTGNIGFHHIHHLSPRIPNYHLERCHRENELFQSVRELTLLESLRCLSFRLWDEDRRKLISFRELKKAA